MSSPPSPPPNPSGRPHRDDSTTPPQITAVPELPAETWYHNKGKGKRKGVPPMRPRWRSPPRRRPKSKEDEWSSEEGEFATYEEDEFPQDGFAAYARDERGPQQEYYSMPQPPHQVPPVWPARGGEGFVANDPYQFKLKRPKKKRDPELGRPTLLYPSTVYPYPTLPGTSQPFPPPGMSYSGYPPGQPLYPPPPFPPPGVPYRYPPGQPLYPPPPPPSQPHILAPVTPQRPWDPHPRPGWGKPPHKRPHSPKPSPSTGEYRPGFPLGSIPPQSRPPFQDPVFQYPPFRPGDRPNAEEEQSSITFTGLMIILPKELYTTLLLLRLPSLYFTRVARIFEEADLSLREIESMVLADGISKSQVQPLFSSEPPQVYKNLKTTWENFIESVMREYKTFNVISVLLLSAILTILQIESAAHDALTRYTAMASLICALLSVLYGCVYIIRFGGMKRTYKGFEFAREAKKLETNIIWNVWVLLAMPAVWLAWSLILYIICIMSFLWRTGPGDNAPRPITDTGMLAVRVTISTILGLGAIYSSLVFQTFSRYGAVMDNQWKERVRGWVAEFNYRAGVHGDIVPYQDPYDPWQSAQRYAPTVHSPLKGHEYVEANGGYEKPWIMSDFSEQLPHAMKHPYRPQNLAWAPPGTNR